MHIDRHICGRWWRATRATRAAAVALAMAGFGVALAWPNPSETAVPANAVFAGLETIEDNELAELRGGFSHPDLPFGLTVSIGGDIKTMIDGSTVLMSTFSITPDGLVAEHMFPDPFVGLEFVDSNSDIVVADLTDGQVQVPDGFTGVVVQGENGSTVALQQLDLEEGRIANIVIGGSFDPNDPNGTSVSQELNLDFEIMGMGNLHNDIRRTEVLSGLTEASRAAALSALSR